jgi:hypothetical protein
MPGKTINLHQFDVIRLQHYKLLCCKKIWSPKNISEAKTPSKLSKKKPLISKCNPNHFTVYCFIQKRIKILAFLCSIEKI